MEDLARTTLAALGLEVNAHTMDVALGVLATTPHARKVSAAAPTTVKTEDDSPGLLLFLQLKVPKIKESNPTATAPWVDETARGRWAALDDESRARFEAKAMKAQSRT